MLKLFRILVLLIITNSIVVLSDTVNITNSKDSIQNFSQNDPNKILIDKNVYDMVLQNANNTITFLEWAVGIFFTLIGIGFAYVSYRNEQKFKSARKELIDVQEKMESSKLLILAEEEKITKRLKEFKNYSKIIDKKLEDIDLMIKELDIKYQKVNEKVDKNAEANRYFEMAFEANENDNFDDAIDYYAKVIEFTENDFLKSIAFNNTAIALMKKNEISSAIEYYNKSIQYKPDFPDAYNNRGNAFAKNNEYDKAIKDYTKAIDLKSDYVDAYNNRGVSFDSCNMLEEAIADFSKAIELKPNNAAAYNNRGVAFEKKNDLDKSINDYSRAIELEPDDANTYNNRGVSYSKKKEFHKALSDFNTAIDLAPHFEDAYINRGSVYAKLGKFENSLIDYTKAIGLNPQFETAFYERGSLHLRLGKLKEAESDYLSALKLSQNKSLVYLSLAELEIVKNNLEASKKYMENIILNNEDAQESIIYSFLSLIIMILEGTITETLLNEFKESIKRNINYFWSTQELQSWINKLELSKTKKKQIQQLIDIFKEKTED